MAKRRQGRTNEADVKVPPPYDCHKSGNDIHMAPQLAGEKVDDIGDHQMGRDAALVAELAGGA